MALILNDDEFQAILPHLYVIRRDGEPITYTWEHGPDGTLNRLEMSMNQLDALHDYAIRQPSVEEALAGSFRRSMESRI
jgi:hypothetical protein